MLESVVDSNMRAWAASLSPGNGHLGGGLPRKRPLGPLVAPYSGNGHVGGGGWRKTTTPWICVNRSHLEHIAPYTGIPFHNSQTFFFHWAIWDRFTHNKPPT